MWGEQYVPGAPVHRLEFEIGRQGLVESDLNTPDQVLAATGDLWAYATTEWLTYRSPTTDQTRSRWPRAPEWHQVQRATLGHRAVGVERLRLARRSSSIEKLLPGLTGYLASLGALIGTEGIDDTLGAVGQHLQNYEVISWTPFAERVAAVLVGIGLRMVHEDSEQGEQEGPDVDRGLLQGVDGVAGGRGVLDRRAG